MTLSNTAVPGLTRDLDGSGAPVGEGSRVKPGTAGEVSGVRPSAGGAR
jgi:hypothetical protein